MYLFVTVLHILLCVALILVILLQPGKDSTGVLMSGGAVNRAYTPRSPGHFLGRATTGIAVLFMCTSIYLALRSTDRAQAGTSDLDDAIRAVEDEEARKGSTAAPEGGGGSFELPDRSQDGSAQPGMNGSEAQGAAPATEGGDRVPAGADQVPQVPGDEGRGQGTAP